MLTTPPAPPPVLDVRAGLLPHAPPPVRAGSRPDAKALRARLQALLQGLERADEVLLRLIDQAQANHIYLVLEDERGEFFPDWTAFATSPQPWGLGISEALVAELAREHVDPKRRARLVMNAPVVLRYQGLRHPGPDRPPPTPPNHRGNPGDYWLARLRRDHPELLEQVADGRLPSIAAAARLAGLVQPRVNVILTPMNVARLIVCHLDPDGQAELVDLVAHPERITAPAGHHSPAWKAYTARRAP